MPQLQLQAAIQQKNEIQAENDELKRTMSQVIGLIQPHLGKSSSNTSGLDGKAVPTYSMQSD